MIEYAPIILGLCILINLTIGFYCLEVFLKSGLNIHYRLAGLWACILNSIIAVFNVWLLISST